jgi:hypothetical protein
MAAAAAPRPCLCFELHWQRLRLHQLLLLWRCTWQLLCCNLSDDWQHCGPKCHVDATFICICCMVLLSELQVSLWRTAGAARHCCCFAAALLHRI